MNFQNPQSGSKIKDCCVIGGTADHKVASGLAVTHIMQPVTRKSHCSMTILQLICTVLFRAVLYLQKWRCWGDFPGWGAEGWASAPLCWRPQRWSGRKYLSSKSWVKEKKKMYQKGKWVSSYVEETLFSSSKDMKAGKNTVTRSHDRHYVEERAD